MNDQDPEHEQAITERGGPAREVERREPRRFAAATWIVEPTEGERPAPTRKYHEF